MAEASETTPEETTRGRALRVVPGGQRERGSRSLDADPAPAPGGQASRMARLCELVQALSGRPTDQVGAAVAAARVDESGQPRDGLGLVARALVALRVARPDR